MEGSPLLVLIPIGRLFGYALLGFLAARFGFRSGYVSALNSLAFNLMLPALIFDNMVTGFSWELLVSYWPLIFFQLLYCAVGYLVFLILMRGGQDRAQRRVQTSLFLFQNSGYIPIALLSAMLPVQQYNIAVNILFILLVGFNLTMFSAGERLFDKEKPSVWQLLNPPLIAILVTMVLVLSGTDACIPDVVIGTAGAISRFTIPLVMFVIGGSIYFSRLGGQSVPRRALARMLFGKGLVLPLIGLLVSLLIRQPVISLLVFIQFLVPPAANLVVLSRKNEQMNYLLSSYMFYTYGSAMFYIPFWLVVYLKVF